MRIVLCQERTNSRERQLLVLKFNFGMTRYSALIILLFI